MNSQLLKSLQSYEKRMVNFFLSISKIKSFPVYFHTSLIFGNISSKMPPFSFFAYFCANGQENIQISDSQYHHQHHSPSAGND